MHEELIDVLVRLVAVERSLGRGVSKRACHAAKVAIAKVVLEKAETLPSKHADSISKIGG